MSLPQHPAAAYLCLVRPNSVLANIIFLDFSAATTVPAVLSDGQAADAQEFPPYAFPAWLSVSESSFTQPADEPKCSANWILEDFWKLSDWKSVVVG